METKTKSHHNHDRYPKYCLFFFVVLWVILAIKPLYRSDWFMENILVFVTAPLIIWSYHKFRLSNLSYTLITIFMSMHILGAHWTYAQVPFLDWLWPMIGATRNHFDRIVHFSFGLLMAYPIREVFLRIANVKGFWGYYLPFDVTASFSAIFEIFEYLGASLVSPELGSAYLGAQGDIWDAQKDMALAMLGAFIAMVVVAIVNSRINPRFGKDMSSSFTVKHAEPLGEVKIAEYKKENELELLKTKRQTALNKKNKNKT